MNKTIRLMEVCGTHTVAIAKAGIRSLLPNNIFLISGPGCPVCVTPQEDIDRIIEIAKQKDVIFATFGDMIRVPGTNSSLEKERANGAEIRIVYSPLDCLKIAKENQSKQVVFMGVGFETTSPTIAATIIESKRQKIKNFFVYPSFKLIPPAMKVLIDDPELKIDGFICPGHVSTIIGSHPYEFLNKPCVIAGFEPNDILEAIEMLVEAVRAERRKVRIQYKRIVKPEGNPKALEILYKVFEPCDSNWRGLGVIPRSGLKFRKEFEKFDASKKFEITGDIAQCRLSKGCICGDILKGKQSPKDCKLFGKACTPENPIGACMVSSEGTCAARFKYETR